MKTKLRGEICFDDLSGLTGSSNLPITVYDSKSNQFLPVTSIAEITEDSEDQDKSLFQGMLVLVV